MVNKFKVDPQGKNESLHMNYWSMTQITNEIDLKNQENDLISLDSFFLQI